LRGLENTVTNLDDEKGGVGVTKGIKETQARVEELEEERPDLARELEELDERLNEAEVEN